MYSIPLTVVFVSFNVCVAKFVCSMLNDCCLRLSNWFSYLDRKKDIQSETMQVGSTNLIILFLQVSEV